MFRSSRSGGHKPLDDEERPAKRISTPAGQRLSMIIESTQARRSKPSATTKINVTTTSTYCNDPSHQHIGPVHHDHKNDHRSSKMLGVVSVLTGGKLTTPRESIDERTPNGSALSVSVWSDKDAEKFGRIRHKKTRCIQSWSRRRIAIVVAILLIFIIALAAGLAVGLKKKPENR
jgi:hypothetical protein